MVATSTDDRDRVNDAVLGDSGAPDWSVGPIDGLAGAVRPQPSLEGDGARGNPPPKPSPGGLPNPLARLLLDTSAQEFTRAARRR